MSYLLRSIIAIVLSTTAIHAISYAPQKLPDKTYTVSITNYGIPYAKSFKKKIPPFGPTITYKKCGYYMQLCLNDTCIMPGKSKSMTLTRSASHDKTGAVTPLKPDTIRVIEYKYCGLSIPITNDTLPDPSTIGQKRTDTYHVECWDTCKIKLSGQERYKLDSNADLKPIQKKI